MGRRTTSTDQERDYSIQRGVYALGVCVVPERLVPVMRTALDEMHGADWVPVPYSLARALHDTMSIHIRQKLPYLDVSGHKLIEIDDVRGEVRMTQLGDMALKKLQAKIATR